MSRKKVKILNKIGLILPNNAETRKNQGNRQQPIKRKNFKLRQKKLGTKKIGSKK
jgi:hypothetical protein